MNQYTASTKVASNPIEPQSSASVLVPCAITDRSLKSTVFVYADMLKVTVKQPKTTPLRATPKRSKVTIFSKRSRKRLIEKMAMMRGINSGHFITLTYAGKFDSTPQQVKEHLSRLRKSILRKYPQAGVCWRMEIKPRLSGDSKGELVPHFHLLLFHVSEDLHELRQWIAETWTRSVFGQICPFALLRTQVEKITSRRHAMSYASKYAAKVTTLEDDESDLIISNSAWGRHWGFFGECDFTPALVIETSVGVAVEMRRYAAKLLKSRRSGYAKRLRGISSNKGWSVFGLGDCSNESWSSFVQSTAWQVWQIASENQSEN